MRAQSSGVADLVDGSSSTTPANTEFLTRRERRAASEPRSHGLSSALPSQPDAPAEPPLTRRGRRRIAAPGSAEQAIAEPTRDEEIHEVAASEAIASRSDSDAGRQLADIFDAATATTEGTEEVIEAEPVELAETDGTSALHTPENSSEPGAGPMASEPAEIWTPEASAANAENADAEPVDAEAHEVAPDAVPTTTESFEQIIAGAFPIDESSVPDEPVEDEPVDTSTDSADEAETPTRDESAEPAADRRGRHGASSSDPIEAPRPPRSIRRIAAKTMSISALLAVGLMTVATSIPANALLSADDVQAQKREALVASQTSAPGDAQSMVNTASADLSVHRDTYGALSAAQTATSLGINPEDTFTNDPNGTVQWPFSVGVHIGSGYGPRAGCSLGCSTNHLGQDFNPGYGAPIQSIADGVVVESTDAGGGFGVKIVIEHVIDGQMIHSLYGHMIPGSRTVQVGDHVSVGQIIGKTGSTGISTGAHLHLEILINGTTHVDPLAWLYENTN